jgi:hypothetical protein
MKLAQTRWPTKKLQLVTLVAFICGCGGGDGAFIPGTADLPDCSDPPAMNLDGTEWFDVGTVTILSAGCPDAVVNDTLMACPLNWTFAQTDNEVTIGVDDEYRLEGRLCGDQLHLRGGWWLPVEDAGQCTYDDDSAEEVRIQAPSNTLTVGATEMTGTLTVEGRCAASYAVTFAQVVQF